jgi:predicted dehydrogenase
MSKVVRIGVAGLGNMGTSHVESFLAKKVSRLELGAVCDANPARLAHYSQIPGFPDAKSMIRSGKIDAILIATPHFDHTETGSDALTQGLHVLVEKPLSVHKADCERLIAAYDKRPKQEQVFACMFNQRTDPHYVKMKQLIQRELGEVRRVNWIVTDWFRSEAYYASSAWRATWSGEGGGILVNQCPHNLDLLQWMFGMPTKVRAHAAFGKWHNIEVEDAVTAYLEFPNGATGVFVTTTGEAPGTNRLEVAGERGRLVMEGGKISFSRNVVPMSEFSRTSKELFARPEVWHIDIPVSGRGGQHSEIVQNFVDCILDGKTLLSPAVEGIRSVEIANAMILSHVLDKTVTFPMDSAQYEAELKRLIATSTHKKKADVPASGGGDFAKSFGT